MNAPLTRKLIRDLWAHKGALIALIVIATIGVSVYVGMATVYIDLEGSRDRYYRDYRIADFTVDLKRVPEWAVDQAATMPNVRAVRGRVSISVMIELLGVDEPIGGRAISMPLDRRPVLNDLLLKSGTWFSDENADEVILNEAFARENGLRPGSRIKVMLLDKQHDLLVVGAAMSPEFVYLMPEGGGLAPDPARFGVMYLPERFLQESCNLEGAWNQIVGLAHDASRGAIDNMLTLFEDRFDAYGVAAVSPIQEQTSARFLQDELTGLKVSTTVLPAIFLGVAALALNVLMGRLVAQQRPVIGTLRALGYSRLDISKHYLAFGVSVGGIGGLCGAAMGLWLQSVYVALYQTFYALPDIVAHFYPSKLAIGMAISVACAVVGTVKGVWSASRLEPAEAMRPPPPEKGGRILLERVRPLWTRLSFRSKMMLRSIFRNPYRSGVGFFASFISTSLIVSTLCLVDAMDYLMSYEFERVSHQDVTVSLRDPKGIRAVSELMAAPSVVDVEAQLGVGCDLSRGPRSKRVGVIGLPRGNHLYTPLDGDGEPIVIPEEGLVLTTKLAEILDAKAGDTVRFRPLIAERREVDAVVATVVESFLGLSAYADQRYLSRLLGEEWVAGSLLFRSYRRGTTPELLSEVKRRPSIIGIGERLRSFTQMEDTFGNTMGIMISVMVLFSGLIAFGSMLNTAIVSLSERQRDVGSLRVIGYTPEQVAWIFSGESFLINGAGVLIGLLGGVGMTHLLSMAYNTELYRFPAIVYPSRLVEGVVIMAAFIVLAQLIAYVMLRRMDWLESLKIKE